MQVTQEFVDAGREYKTWARLNGMTLAVSGYAGGQVISAVRGIPVSLMDILHDPIRTIPSNVTSALAFTAVCLIAGGITYNRMTRAARKLGL